MIYSGVSEKGPIRERNEDSYAACVINGCLCMVVADGLGGEVSGEIASKLAVDTVISLFEQDQEGIKDAEHLQEFLSSVFNKTNKAILRYGNEHPESRGMCTTLTVAIQQGTKLYISHIGDTRAYLCHKREIQKLTIDHNKAAELVRNGQISESEAKIHPGRHVLVKVLGENVYLRPDFFSYNINYGDIVLLCSDGLYSFIGKEDFIDALNYRKDLKIVCEHLIDKALKNGSSDNLTVIAGLVRPDGNI